MKHIIILFGIIFCFLADAEARTDEWKKERMAEIDASLSLPDQQKIEVLGRIVRAGSHILHPPNENQLEVAKRASDLLTKIDGHATYYENKIKQARLRYEEAIGNGDIGATKNDLYNEQMYGFETLRQLPSPETVRVLGEFLFDDRGMPNLPPNPTLMDAERARAERPNSILAARALNELPLVTRPYPKKDMYSLRYKDIHPWRLWYEQVKAGTRTFRFEEDPQEYNLDGPVRHAKDGPSTQRPSKRDAPEGEAVEERATVFTPGRMIFTGMAALLCLWAWWRYGKMGPKRAV